jgi:FtsP/CotA-like multicopper oxidase with cupredoxin domain
MRFPSFTSTALLLFAAAAAQAQATYERARPNDNRARAGVTMAGTVAIRMEARLAQWHPQGDDAPGIVIPVFAEIGRPAQVPGPVIRVPGGTNVIVTIRNMIPNHMLTIHGLHSRPAIGATFNDSVQVGPGAVHTLRFRLDRPGTYYYWGTTTRRAFDYRTKDDAQLTGVIVVDEPGVRTPTDRILVIGMLSDTTPSETIPSPNQQLFVVNGRAWPHTDRLIYQKGETVRWRVINASAGVHPMHLHGFYYRVHRRGNGRADSALVRTEFVNTELLRPGQTMMMSWVPNRLGNWLFHCHIPEHIAPRGPFGARLSPYAEHQAHANPNPAVSMGGLVTAVEVRPAEDDTTANQPPPLPPEPSRRLHMHLRPNAGSTSFAPFYGVALTEGTSVAPEVQRGHQIGEPLILNRGETVSINVHNSLPEPTSVHWHGIELDSYFDGVPGISGVRPMLATQIAPNDSFDVRFTPPRAGTFIYHSHVNEARQQRAGVAGALIVVDRGKFDATRDHPVVFSSPIDSVAETQSVLINGSATPFALDLRRGITHRLRFINITTARPNLTFEMKEDTAFATWRPVAKDGADLPVAARTPRLARQTLSIGETMDFELLAARPGEYTLEVRTRNGALLAVLPIRVN